MRPGCGRSVPSEIGLDDGAGLPFTAMRSRVSHMASALGPSLCAALSVAVMACGRPETAADRQFAEMREQVTRMQADHDKVDQRLDALEVGIEGEKDSRTAAAAPGKPAAGVATPQRTVQIGDPSDSDAADPNDTSPRPDIRATGPAGAANFRPRSGKSNARGRIDEPELAPLRSDPPSTRSSALDPDAKKAYEAALAQVQAKQYDRGLEGLNAFLVRWPDHPYAENAVYWRGEAFYAQGEYLRAAEQFDAVLSRFGSGSKAPDALLKLGLCHDKLGAPQRAQQYWERLKTEFPRSDAAKRIPSGRDALPSPKGPKENR